MCFGHFNVLLASEANKIRGIFIDRGDINKADFGRPGPTLVLSKPGPAQADMTKAQAGPGRSSESQAGSGRPGP